MTTAKWDFLSRFLFPAPPPSYTPDSFPEEMIFVPKDLELGDDSPATDRVPCLFLKYPSARFLILYLHSNAEDIGKCYGFCSVMREQFQVHVLAVEYPGYGICMGGPPTAENVTENAFVAFRFVREVLKWPMENIKIFGRSIGTGPAITLAVQYKVAGLILVAPFLSIRELLKDTVGPFSSLIEERFANKDRMHLIRSPVLIIHGRNDKLIPCNHGSTLYDLSKGRKLLVSPESMEHNTNLLLDVGYLVLPMLQFFSLPDYCFEELHVPVWAFGHNGCRQELALATKDQCDAASAADMDTEAMGSCGMDAVTGEAAGADDAPPSETDSETMLERSCYFWPLEKETPPEKPPKEKVPMLFSCTRLPAEDLDVASEAALPECFSTRTRKNWIGGDGRQRYSSSAKRSSVLHG